MGADAEVPPAAAYRAAAEARSTDYSHHGVAEDWQQLEVWVFLYDVGPATAPLQFWANRPDEARRASQRTSELRCCLLLLAGWPTDSRACAWLLRLGLG